MSDGPYRSLKMTRPWRKLAEAAYYDAYSIEEVARALIPALDRSCRDEVPPNVWHDLARIFTDQQNVLFSDQKAGEAVALRNQVAGMPLGCALIDAAERA